MKILIACEYSGRVREAFAARGHYAVSCDLRDSEIVGRHYKGDVRKMIGEFWDMMIAFPPCTHLASSGAQYWKEKRKNGLQQAAIEFVLQLANAPIEKIAIENPAGILSTIWKKPDQYIHPYQFGDPYYKRTGLWLQNLPLLKSTHIVEPIAHWHGGCRRGGMKKDGTRTACKLPTALKYGEVERSRTFKGIAEAMAEQWGNLAPK